MDNAVAQVQAYLQVNGYLTVTEYPVLEAARDGIEAATWTCSRCGSRAQDNWPMTRYRQ